MIIKHSFEGSDHKTLIEGSDHKTLIEVSDHKTLIEVCLQFNVMYVTFPRPIFLRLQVLSGVKPVVYEYTGMDVLEYTKVFYFE
jgi:hypothetical protein